MRTSPLSRRISKGAAAVLAIIITVGGALTGCSPGERVAIENARVRALIPGQDKTVAYMDVHNGTRTPVTLVGAVSRKVQTIEFHTTRMEDGVMRMRRLDEVTVDPGETIQFQPGGRHLMLFGVRSLSQVLEIELRFTDGTTTEVSFEKIAIGAQ